MILSIVVVYDKQLGGFCISPRKGIVGLSGCGQACARGEAPLAENSFSMRKAPLMLYVARFGEAAARRIEDALPERDRETLARALRVRPEGSEPLSIVDYLYLAQLPPLLFAADVWQNARVRLGDAPDVKQRIQSALGRIAPVRNEIAHVREVDRDRLLRASVACADLLEMLQGKAGLESGTGLSR